MPWRRRLVASTCLLQRTSGFDPREVHAIFIVDTVKRGHIFLQVLRFSPVTIIPPVPHTHLHVILIRTNGRSLIIFQKQCVFENLWSLIQPDILIWWCGKGARPPGRLNFVWWRLILVDPQSRTCSLSHFWRQEFWVAREVLKNSSTPLMGHGPNLIFCIGVSLQSVRSSEWYTALTTTTSPASRKRTPTRGLAVHSAKNAICKPRRNNRSRPKLK